MPIPTPKGNESQDNFVSRCVSSEVVQNEFDSQDQRLAVCYSTWRRSQTKSNPRKFKDIAQGNNVPWSRKRIGQGKGKESLK